MTTGMFSSCARCLGGIVIEPWFSNLKVPRNHLEGLLAYKFPCSDPPSQK